MDHPRGGKRLRFDQPLTGYPARRQRLRPPISSQQLPTMSPIAPTSSGPAQQPISTDPSPSSERILLPPNPSALSTTSNRLSTLSTETRSLAGHTLQPLSTAVPSSSGLPSVQTAPSATAERPAVLSEDCSLSRAAPSPPGRVLLRAVQPTISETTGQHLSIAPTIAPTRPIPHIRNPRTWPGPSAAPSGRVQLPAVQPAISDTTERHLSIIAPGLTRSST